jgi:hypothetical protein
MAMRIAGEMTLALDVSLGKLELVPADQVLVDGVKALAVKLDTVGDENLILRYHAHYARYLGQLVKRSDANRARRLAEEAERRAEQDDTREDRLDRLRRESAEREAERVVYEQREMRKVARLKAKGLTVDQIAAQMKCHRSIVAGYLADYQRAERRGA